LTLSILAQLFFASNFANEPLHFIVIVITL
jgi:hypothetical protein